MEYVIPISMIDQTAKIKELTAQLAEYKKLEEPGAVHVNILRGTLTYKINRVATPERVRHQMSENETAENCEQNKQLRVECALGAGQLQAGGALRIAVFAIEDAFRSLDNHWRTKLDRQAYLGKRTELDTVRLAVLDSIKPVWDLVDKP